MDSYIDNVLKKVKSMNLVELNDKCKRWAIRNGFVQRWLSSPMPDTIIPYPFTLYPSPFPYHEYENACRMQYGINKLIYRLASNIDLLDSVLLGLVDCDDFVRKLQDISQQIQNLPYKSVAEGCIIRTDYMLQTNVNEEHFHKTRLRLIEINTIAVGLGGAAKLMSQWHNQFISDIDPTLSANLPSNESHDLIINLIYESWKIYDNVRAIILFVIPAREFNIGDQILIENGLMSLNENIFVKHVTFKEINQHASIDQSGNLYFMTLEVAVVYYRHGYDPRHFENETIWQSYLLLESSRSIKIPSIRYHLAGMKCFQMKLNFTDFLEKVYEHDQQSYYDDYRSVTEESFTIEQAATTDYLRNKIHVDPEGFYLKQNREGGGSVYCGKLLNDRISEIMEAKQNQRYFVMKRIIPPQYTNIIRSSNGELKECLTNSELGIFGAVISQGSNILYSKCGGSLLRSKPCEKIEGGIASGAGAIDSVILIKD